MTSGYDIRRRRSRRFSRPFSKAASTMASITPSPRWRSNSPSRTKSGSQPPAGILPSLRATAGAVTTGRQNTASSPAAGPASAGNYHPAVNTQVTGPYHDRSRRRPRVRERHSDPACISDGRQIRRHEGSWTARIRHPDAYQEPSSQAKRLISLPRPVKSQVTAL